MPFIDGICVSFAFNFAQILQHIVLYGRDIRFLFSYHFRMNVVCFYNVCSFTKAAIARIVRILLLC